MENKFEKQKKLATVIKSIHKELRDLTDEVGAEEGWRLHLENKDKLDIYAKSMNELSEEHWKERNASSDDRIQWIINSCDEYFQDEVLQNHRRKDYEVIEKLKSEGIDVNLEQLVELKISDKLKVIDVGSSGSFFKKHQKFEILPIDIAPSSEDVLFCDFLSVSISTELSKDSKKVNSIPANYFDIVIFCLLLEYLPTSDMRIKCCEKAYEVLKYEGILCIVTPDSNYQHINAQQIKTWKWVLAKMGFKRIKIEKLTNLSCMVFRKSLSSEIPKRWAELKKDGMEFKMIIPQEREKMKEPKNEKQEKENCEFNKEIMNELPFE